MLQVGTKTVGLSNSLESPYTYKLIMIKQILESEINENWISLKLLVQGIVKDPTLADDVLQTALVKALTTGSQPKSESKIVPWFKTILKNTALDVLRKQKSVQEKEQQAMMERVVYSDEFESSACSCVLGLLGRLSTEDQLLLKKLDIEDVSLKELEKSTGISKSTLKVRRHRARKRLKNVVMDVCNVGSAQECDDCDCPS